MITTAPPLLSVDLLAFVRTMAAFYGVAAMAISLVLLVEYRLGAFPGLTLIEAFARTLNPAFLYSDPTLIGLL